MFAWQQLSIPVFFPEGIRARCVINPPPGHLPSSSPVGWWGRAAHQRNAPSPTDVGAAACCWRPRVSLRAEEASACFSSQKSLSREEKLLAMKVKWICCFSSSTAELVPQLLWMELKIVLSGWETARLLQTNSYILCKREQPRVPSLS